MLRNYLDRFDPAFIGLTGPARLDHRRRRGPRASPSSRGTSSRAAGYDITHGTAVLGIDGDDEVPILWTQGTSATQFASDVHQLLEG